MPRLKAPFWGAFLADNLAVAFRSVIALSTLLSLLISWRYAEQSGTPVGEYAAILLAATLGAMLLCGATDLVSVFISLETLSVASYLLSGYMKRDARSSEAALKYLLVGSAAAAVFLYGSSLLYGLSGSTSLEAIGVALQTSTTPVAALSLVFVLATVAFKIAAVPFHQWTPDVYEGSPTPVVAFLSVGSKAAGFALALRILVGCFGAFDGQWKLLFTVLAVLSMTLGNVVALAQTSMKRMLAYSSIGQAGFVMIGMVCGTEDGFAAMVLYMAAYLFMNLGAFACIILFSIRTGSDRISDYAGLYQKDPLITLGLSLCLLSLGGIPPMLGFFGKIYLFFRRLGRPPIPPGCGRIDHLSCVDLLLHLGYQDDGRERAPGSLRHRQGLPRRELVRHGHAALARRPDWLRRRDCRGRYPLKSLVPVGQYGCDQQPFAAGSHRSIHPTQPWLSQLPKLLLN